MSLNNSISVTEPLVLYITCYQSNEQYHMYGAHHTVLMTVWILALLLILPITLPNMFVIHVFMSKEQANMSSNSLLLHTAVCDAMFGCVAMPLWSSYLGGIILSRSYSCILMGFSNFFALTLAWMSFLTTFLIALDKHLAIFHPYIYESRIQGRRHMTILPIIAFWLIMVLLQVTWFFTDVPLLKWAAFIIPILCVYCACIHIRIYTTVKRTRIQVRSLKVTQRKGSSGSKGKSKDDHEDVKAARLTSFMLASLCICYLPYFALQISRMAYGNKRNPALHTSLPVVLLIGAFKCFINPLLYYCQKEAIRKSFNRISVKLTAPIKN